MRLIATAAILSLKVFAQSPIDAQIGMQRLAMTATPFRVNPGTVQVMTQNIDRPGELSVEAAARGGTGNDITVTVTIGNRVIYSSGQRTYVSFRVPVQPGTYQVVFDNRASVVSQKSVWAEIQFFARTIEEPSQAPAQSTARPTSTPPRETLDSAARNRAQNFVREVVQQFNLTSPDLVHNKDIHIEARVEGFEFSLADSLGDDGAQVVAASIAHAIAHAVYQLPAGQKGEADSTRLLREFSGETTMDVAIEPEIEVITVDLLCRAGFDPKSPVATAKAYGSGNNPKHPLLSVRVKRMESIAVCPGK